MKKKNNIFKKLIPAAGMLLLSTAMLATSTFAWFTMNKTVSVTGMKVKATADQGLVISDSTKTGWATSWDVGMTAGVLLAPTSITNAAAATSSLAWVRNESDHFDNADADQDGGYENLTLTWSTEAPNSGAVGSVTTGTAPNEITTNYALKRTFFIKSSGQEAWNENLVIDSVTATGNTNSAALDNSLRVLVVVNEVDAFIYAPFSGATMSYNYKGTATGATAVTAIASTTDSTCTHVTSIPNTDAGAVKVEMYMYFEGEDAGCKSSNISGVTVDELNISANFKTTAGPAD